MNTATPVRPADAGDTLDVHPTARSSARRFVRPAAAGLCLAIAAARFLSVDIAGIVTNDSLGYLRRSGAPFASGFVVEGYRQMAYPLLLSVSTWIGDVFGWDPIFGIAFAQRIALAAAIGVVVWALRWWSAPLVVVFTSATYVLHADYLLPEGVLVPLSVVVGGLLASVVMNRVGSRLSARVALAAITATAVLAATVKLQYAALLIVCAAAAYVLRRDGVVTDRFIATCFVAAGAVVGCLALFQSIENRHERGVFEPVSERSFAEWYGAWMAVFGVHPERSEDPALAEWYDGGNLYTFLGQAMQEYPDYPERSEVLGDRIDDMFDAAGMSHVEEHAAAFLGALSGGRTDDLESKSDEVLGAGPGDPWVGLAQNRLAWNDRMDELIAQYNDGLPPGFISFGPVFDASQDLGGDYRSWKGVIAWSSIAVMLPALFVRGRHRVATIGILSMAIVTAAMLASAYIDNARYLLGPLSLLAVGGVLSLRALARFAVAELARRGLPQFVARISAPTARPPA